MLCLAILQESCVCLVSCSAMLTLKLLIFLRILFASLISSLLLKLASNIDHAKMRFCLSPKILKRKYFFSKGISGSTTYGPKVSFSAICWTVSTAIPSFLYREYLIFFIYYWALLSWMLWSLFIMKKPTKDKLNSYNLNNNFVLVSLDTNNFCDNFSSESVCSV